MKRSVFSCFLLKKTFVFILLAVFAPVNFFSWFLLIRFDSFHKLTFCLVAYLFVLKKLVFHFSARVLLISSVFSCIRISQMTSLSFSFAFSFLLFFSCFYLFRCVVEGARVFSSTRLVFSNSLSIWTSMRITFLHFTILLFFCSLYLYSIIL